MVQWFKSLFQKKHRPYELEFRSDKLLDQINSNMKALYALRDEQSYKIMRQTIFLIQNKFVVDATFQKNWDQTLRYRGAIEGLSSLSNSIDRAFLSFKEKGPEVAKQGHAMHERKIINLRRRNTSNTATSAV